MGRTSRASSVQGRGSSRGRGVEAGGRPDGVDWGDELASRRRPPRTENSGGVAARAGGTRQGRRVQVAVSGGSGVEARRAGGGLKGRDGGLEGG